MFWSQIYYIEDYGTVLQSSYISFVKLLANVSKCNCIFFVISNLFCNNSFCTSLNLLKFCFALSIIVSNIYLVYFTFNSYYYCYFYIYFILLNLFTFLSIVASTESCEKTWRVSYYYKDFFNFILRVLTFSNIYFFDNKSLCKIF